MNKRTALIGGLVLLGLFVAAALCLGCGVLGYSFNLLIRNNVEASGPPVDIPVMTPIPLDPGLDSPTIRTLEEEEIPINDPVDLAQRLQGKEDLPRTLPSENLDYQVGDTMRFWVSNTDTAENFQVTTLLAAKSDHLYFWIEEGVDYSQRALDRLVEDFEENIYPTNRQFFGSEWSPGVDEDPRLYVIYATGLGNTVAGYFSSANEYHPEVNEYSNAHETFLLSADNISLSSDFTYGVMAHEFQHMIHWYRDRNETSWLNEGFSELATLLTNHRVTPGHDFWYAENPDSQLNDWPNEPENDFATLPHYGSSFLFVTYFLDRFGSEATQELVSNDLNGLTSVDAVLADLEIINPDTGDVQTADTVFLDWVVTNYLKDEYNTAERFRYTNYPGAPAFMETEEIDRCPTELNERQVAQYGVDYILLTCRGSYTLRFEGETTVQLIPEDPYSGEYAYWSNKGDQSNMTLTREFDFTESDGPLTLEYWTWFDIEKDYDYLHLEVSENGEDWIILETPSGTREDPSGNSYGWGYNGLSGGSGTWIQEQIDLSAYQGKVVQIRFEYITDDAVHGEGFLVDDISIPEIGYFTDFEQDDGGWEGAGFVRIQNQLPQEYRLALLHLGAEPSVQYLPLSADNSLDLPVEIGVDGSPGRMMLVVTGTTRYTRQRADYRFEIGP